MNQKNVHFLSLLQKEKSNGAIFAQHKIASSIDGLGSILQVCTPRYMGVEKISGGQAICKKYDATFFYFKAVKEVFPSF